VNRAALRWLLRRLQDTRHGPENPALPLVRRKCRGGRELLRRHISGQPRRGTAPRTRRLPVRQEGRCADHRGDGARHARPAAQRRAGIQVQRGREFPGRDRRPGGNRPLLECDYAERWRAERVRLVQGSFRPVVADHATAPDRTHRRGRRERGTRVPGDDGHGQDRHRRTRCGGGMRRSVLNPAESPSCRAAGAPLPCGSRCRSSPSTRASACGSPTRVGIGG
jgi:hypothetical protein